MKILYLSGFYPEIGGPLSALSNLLVNLVEKQIQVKVLSPLPKYYDAEKLGFVKKLNFEIKYVRESVSKFFFPSFSFKFLNAIRRESEDCDLIHTNGVFDFYSIIVSLMSKKPYILSPCGSLMEKAYNKAKFKKKIFMLFFGKRIIRNAKKIYLMTKEEEKHFIRYYPEYANKVSIIPNGIKPSPSVNIPVENYFLKKNPELKNKKVILFLGRINWIKGLDSLVPAFSRVVSENKDCHLLICGEDNGDGYAEKIKSLVKKHKIENSVAFSGLIGSEEKLDAFRIAEMLVSPSYSENFGMAIVEAMASGVPVVLSDKVGVSREIRANNAGIIVQPNPESLYKGMKTLLDDENLRKIISENGKKMVKEYYDIDKVADQTIRMYKEVLNK